MGVDDIIKIITSVGFPIVMCLLMFFYMEKQNEKHEKEIKDLSDTIDNNTRILTELSTLIKTIIK